MPTIKDIIIRKPTAPEQTACKNWPIWTCNVSQFEWEYTQSEKCLVLEGQVSVSDNPDSGTSVTFAHGDYVVFPNGLKCIWKVEKSVRKHYDFE